MASGVPADVSRTELQDSPFVFALASDSADDSDTVACVTDQRTVKHGPIANTPPDVEHFVFGFPAQSASTVTWMTSSNLAAKEVQHTSLASLEVTRDPLQLCL